MSRPEKQPWNPYPLASLSARKTFHLSPCAMTILMYLAARTDFRGKTWVGQTRVKDDLGRSKDFVTKGFKELKDRRLIEVTPGCRLAKQADRVILSPALLRNPAWQELEAQNPVQQEDEVGDQKPARQEDDGVQNPARQENRNPARQEETLQLNHNLTGDPPPNLVEQLVSQSVGSGSSLRSSPVSQPGVDNNQNRDAVLKQGKTKPEPALPCPRTRALAEELGYDASLPALFGVRYWTSEQGEELHDLAAALLHHNRGLPWLKELVLWARESKFWSSRLHAGTRGMSQLVKHLYKGEIAEQFNAFLAAKHRGVWEKPNSYTIWDKLPKEATSTQQEEKP